MTFVDGLDKLSCAIEVLGNSLRQSNERMRQVLAAFERNRQLFEATLSDDERRIYAREVEAGAGYLDAAVAIEERRLRLAAGR